MKETIFTHPTQLNRLHIDPLRRTRGMGRLVLGGSMADHPRKKEYENELNLRFYACGCEQGATGVVAGLLGGGVWQMIRYFQNTELLGQAIIWILTLMVGGAVLGKIWGLLRATTPLKIVVREIQKNWVVEQPPGKPIFDCG